MFYKISPILLIIVALTNPALAATINVGIPESTRIRHPLAPDVDQSKTIMQLLAPTLLNTDDHGEWTCQLCVIASESDIARVNVVKKNRRTYITSTWTMRRDLKWGDGTPVTNKDVVLAWQIIRATRHPAYVELLSSIEEIRPDEKDHYTWHADHRGVTFIPSAFAQLRLIPAHIESTLWRDQNGNFATYMQKTQYETSPTNKGLFAGYYLPAEATQAPRQILLQRHPSFQKDLKLVDAIRLRTTDTTEQARSELSTRGIMLVEEDFNFGYTLLQQLRKNKDGTHLTTQASNWVEFITLNIRNPLLADARIRQALTFAIDREQLSNLLQLPTGSIAKGLFAEADYRFIDFSKTLIFDKAAAEKVLHETGWILSEKDKLRWRGGKTFKLEIVYDGSSAYRKLVADFLRDSWRSIGIQVELKAIESSRGLAALLRKIDYTGVALFARHMDADVAPDTLFYSKAIPSAENDYNGQNFSVWRNSQVDAALDALHNPKTSDRDRSKYYQIIANQFAADAPGLPLFFHPKILLTPTPVTGFKAFFGELPGILRVCTTF